MLKKSLLIITISLIAKWTFSQVDYNIERPNYIIVGCGAFPKEDVKSNIDTLNRLAKDSFQNKFMLYRDLGMNYYRLWAYEKDDKWLELAITNIGKSIDLNPEFAPNYFDQAICYLFLKNCQKVNDNIEKYKSKTKRKERDKAQLKELKNNCG